MGWMVCNWSIVHQLFGGLAPVSSASALTAEALAAEALRSRKLLAASFYGFVSDQNLCCKAKRSLCGQIFFGNVETDEAPRRLIPRLVMDF